ncbi:CCA tRNA nucleotidyltransferase [Chloroflexota bacterium]
MTKLFVEEKTAALLRKVADFITQQNIDCYLVGGYIRDALLGRPTKDIDIALPAALEVARKLADVLGGKYVLLDDANGVARVVLVEPAQGSQWHLDFASIKEDVEADLSHRDFTIDAIAVNLRELDEARLIDPFQGQEDLERGLIKAVSETAFQDDPARLLRAVRMSAEYGFTIDEKTEALIQAQSELIGCVAGERVREELCRLLSTPVSARYLYSLDRLGLLTAIFPELELTRGVDQPWEHHWDVFHHSIETVEAVERLLKAGEMRQDQILSLVPRPSTFIQHFEEQIGGGPTRSVLIKLAALLHDVAKPQTKSVEPNGRARFLGHTQEGAKITGHILQRLRFSTRETKMVQKMVESHLRLWQMGDDKPTRRAIYRYFRDTADVSMDIMFLALADYLATYGPNLELDGWKQSTQLMEYILSEREKEESIVTPPKLIDGHDLMGIFALKPGSQIGKLLEAVREAQASGEVTTREEALAFVRGRLDV